MNTIVWFRRDLRLRDNPALSAAAARGRVLPLFILDEAATESQWPLGSASRWWLHHSLAALRKNLGGLILLRGDPRELLPALAAKANATAVFWNRCYEPDAIARDTDLKASLRHNGIEVRSFNGNLLHEPWQIETGSGGPFKVYTPYWRACLGKPVTAPLPAPPVLSIAYYAAGDRLDDWKLTPADPDWASGWNKLWTPGESGALARFAAFVDDAIGGYGDLRDRPDLPKTSRLSPHLHWGEISPRQIWARLTIDIEEPARRSGAAKFLSEIGWREFAHHLLYHFPTLAHDNWRPAFDAYPWRDSPRDLRLWQRGMTGYPFVDAGMRELWRTGWMHNRVRMVAASFLVKHLRIDWRHGQAWFWDTLLDADLANNAAGWQWVAGSGADASPYFRIFNPVAQGEKFDPNGDYVRKWCPELALLPNEHIHAPFAAGADVLARAAVTLGKDYPLPIVDHAEARQAALDGYQRVRSARA